MRTPNARRASWPQNLMNTRPGVENLGDDMAIDPSPATGDRNELREIQKRAVPAMAKGGKVKATGPAKVHKGEHVIRKAAAQKYGPSKMTAVNKGTARITTEKGKR